jgi:hypothetical protein
MSLERRMRPVVDPLADVQTEFGRYGRRLPGESVAGYARQGAGGQTRWRKPGPAAHQAQGSPHAGWVLGAVGAPGAPSAERLEQPWSANANAGPKLAEAIGAVQAGWGGRFGDEASVNSCSCAVIR